MDKIRSLLARLVVGAVAYSMLEVLFSSEGKRRGILEGAAKTAAAALTAAIIDI